MTFASAEEELLWFLSKMSQPGWKWPSRRSALPPEHTAVMYCKFINITTSNSQYKIYNKYLRDHVYYITITKSYPVFWFCNKTLEFNMI